MVCGCSGRYRFRTSRTRVPSLCERARHHASSATHRLSVSRRQFFSSRQSRRAQDASQVRVHASVPLPNGRPCRPANWPLCARRGQRRTQRRTRLHFQNTCGMSRALTCLTARAGAPVGCASARGFPAARSSQPRALRCRGLQARAHPGFYRLQSMYRPEHPVSVAAPRCACLVGLFR